MRLAEAGLVLGTGVGVGVGAGLGLTRHPRRRGRIKRRARKLAKLREAQRKDLSKLRPKDRAKLETYKRSRNIDLSARITTTELGSMSNGRLTGTALVANAMTTEFRAKDFVKWLKSPGRRPSKKQRAAAIRAMNADLKRRGATWRNPAGRKRATLSDSVRKKLHQDAKKRTNLTSMLITTEFNASREEAVRAAIQRIIKRAERRIEKKARESKNFRGFKDRGVRRRLKIRKGR